MSHFNKVPASLVFAAISEFWFSGFSRFIVYKLTTAATALLIVLLVKSNNKKLDQIIFHVSDNLIIFHVQSYFVLHMCKTIIDNNYKPLIIITSSILIGSFK